MASYAEERCFNCSQKTSDIWIMPSCQHRICISCLLDEEVAKDCEFCRTEQCAQCVNASNGCGVSLRKQEGRSFADHVKICEYRKTPCPNNCPERVFNRDLLNHVAKECPKRLKECNHCHDTFFAEEFEIHLTRCDFVAVKCEFCEEETLRKDMSCHLQACNLAKRPCEWSRFGCEFTGIWSELQNHAVLNAHATLMMDYMRRSEESMNAFRNDVAALQDEIQTLKANQNDSENSLEGYKSIITSLQDENKMYKQDNASKEQEIQDYRNEIKALNETVSVLKIDGQCLREKIEDLNVSVSAAVQDVELMKSANEDFKRRLDQDNTEKKKYQEALLNFRETFQNELLRGLETEDVPDGECVRTNDVVSCLELIKNWTVGIKHLQEVIMMRDDTQLLNIPQQYDARITLYKNPNLLNSVCSLGIEQFSMFSYTYVIGPVYRGVWKQVTYSHDRVQLLVRFKFLIRKEETDVFAEVSHSTVQAVRVVMKNFTTSKVILETTLRGLLSRFDQVPIFCGSFQSSCVSELRSTGINFKIESS